MTIFIRYAFKVWYRDFLVWTRYWWTSLIGGLGEPVLYFLAMGYGLGSFVKDIQGYPYVQFLAPGLICSTIMHSASFETTYSSYTRMAIQKTYHSIAVTPINVGEVIAGEILWGATKAMLSGGIMLVAVIAMGILPQEYLPNLVFLIPLLVVEAILFSALGMLMTSFAKDYDFFTYYFTLGLEPMFLFSGTFFPLDSLPPLVQKAALFLPLASPVALARSLVLGVAYPHGLWEILWPLILMAAISAWAIQRMVRRLMV
ncbi:MAG TPA: ABC transporter permease [bacterium]|nr:ABC transporter permease [bacterium]